MPLTPPHRCPTCRQLTIGTCPTCVRLSPSARGYDADWFRARAAHLLLEPNCRFCLQVGRTVSANQVDHIVRFNGQRDPLRLDPRNFRSLCASCHAKHTRESQPSMKSAPVEGSMRHDGNRVAKPSGVHIPAGRLWRLH